MSLRELGRLCKTVREAKQQTQDNVARLLNLEGNSRHLISQLENGHKIPADTLRSICKHLDIPEEHWSHLATTDGQTRFEFEMMLSELTGQSVSLSSIDPTCIQAAERQISLLLSSDFTPTQAFDSFNRILTFYSIPPMQQAFFDRYIWPNGYRPLNKLEHGVRCYQAEAIRLFSTFQIAYQSLNSTPSLDQLLRPLNVHKTEHYRGRTDWDLIEQIPDDHLQDLGYISAAKIHEERAERDVLSRFLLEVADSLRKDGRTALNSIPDTRKRKMSSLLRKFGSSISHDFSSTLFAPDPDQLTREAAKIAPTDEAAVERIGVTQQIAQRNLAQYLTADHMDVYVATSMRSHADFVSVNSFVSKLFAHDEIRPFKLRYFNPTQSWIGDRVAKGLVEALMLRRASHTIYMAQKEDTFGKDSEASVALGQGKPVLVFVPKLEIPEVDIDSALLGTQSRSELVRLLSAEHSADDIDDTVDHVALLGRLLTLRIAKASTASILDAVRRYWADFDLYGDATRIANETLRADYRVLIDSVRVGNSPAVISDELKSGITGILVANAVRAERRAQIFREVHPLALQVILSTGVLNGILVVRSIDQCATLLQRLLHNRLKLKLVVDNENYRLVEEDTNSTIRVISRNRLLVSAFRAHY